MSGSLICQGSEYARVLNRLRLQKALSYPKPPVLNMKWENGDINILELANIRKCSKLNDIGTPPRHFELFFDDALVDMLYSATPSCTFIKRK